MAYFKNKRYITPGIQHNIAPHIMQILWNVIDNISVEKDYLQIFELETIGEGDSQVQVIKHHQEQPPFQSPIIYIPFGPFYTGKVYAIDDSSASVMCLPEER